MQLSFSRRLAAGSAAIAVALGGAVAVGAAPATAGTKTIQFTCTGSVAAELPVKIVTNIPDVVPPGYKFTPKVSAYVPMSENARGQLWFFGHRYYKGEVSSVTTIDGVAQEVPLTVPAGSIPEQSSPENPWIVVASGSTAPFTAGTSGTHTVRVPSFDAKIFVGATPDADQAELSVNCVVKEGSSDVVTTVKVSKLTPKVSAKASKSSVKRGKSATFSVSVGSSPVASTGKVKVSVAGKSKTVTLKNGKATAKVLIPKSTKPGKKTVKVSYLGDKNVKAASKSFKITVKK